ncbi:L-threonylcarbamoyladenylate synthase [soil metagenome]
MTQVIDAHAPDAIKLAVAELSAGRIVAIPTETVYGLAVLPTEEAVAALIAAKQRSADKGIQLLIDSIDQAAALAVLTPAAQRLAGAFWPGGLTLVLARRPGSALPTLIGGGRPTLGLRLPDHHVPRLLARRLGPLAASSANITGEPDATTAERVVESLGAAVSLVLDDGPVRGGVPSSVVDCSMTGQSPRILREGAISAQAIADLLGPDYTSG